MKNMFNIYYINNEKASEISLLFDNQIVEKITRIKNTELAMAGDGDVTTSDFFYFQNSCYRTVFTKHRSEWKFIS